MTLRRLILRRKILGTFYFRGPSVRTADGVFRTADENADGRRCALSCNCPRGTLSGEGRRGLLKDISGQDAL